MIYSYLRVSTNRQDLENQKFEIKEFANKNVIKIDKWIQEKVSTSKRLEVRKLNGLLKKLHPSDILICSEISRLGRNLYQVMSILNHCMEKSCNVWVVKGDYKFGDDIASQTIAFALSIGAQIEKELIKARTAKTLERLRSEGKILGRPKGSKNQSHKLYGKENKIKKLLDQKLPKTQIAKIMKVNRMTLHRFIEKMLS